MEHFVQGIELSLEDVVKYLCVMRVMYKCYLGVDAWIGKSSGDYKQAKENKLK